MQSNLIMDVYTSSSKELHVLNRFHSSILLTKHSDSRDNIMVIKPNPDLKFRLCGNYYIYERLRIAVINGHSTICFYLILDDRHMPCFSTELIFEIAQALSVLYIPIFYFSGYVKSLITTHLHSL